MAERIQYEKAYQVRIGRAPAGERDTLPVSDVRLRELGVTRAAPKQTIEPGGAAERTLIRKCSRTRRANSSLAMTWMRTPEEGGAGRNASFRQRKTNG